MQPVDLSEMMERPGCFTGAKSEGRGAATLDREGSRPALYRKETGKELLQWPVSKSPPVAVREDGRSARQSQGHRGCGREDSPRGPAGSGWGHLPTPGSEAFAEPCSVKARCQRPCWP